MCKMKKKKHCLTLITWTLGVVELVPGPGHIGIGICLTQQLVMAIQQFLAVKNWKSISQKLLSNC